MNLLGSQEKMKHFRLAPSLFLIVASFLAFFVYAPTNALAVGQWVLTGQMNFNIHNGEPVALLQNGKVIIAGGLNGAASGGVSNISELYDPSTGQWTQTGNLGVGLAEAFPVALNDGRVLIAGGTTYGYSNTPTSTSELYDPSTGQWTYTGNLHVARTNAPAVKLSDGRVLIISGSQGNFDNDTSTSELYDPSTGQWTQTGNVNNPIFAGGTSDVVLLNDGRFLKVGNAPGGNSTVAELYDPSTGQWTTTGNLLLARYSTKLIKLQDGRVLMISGDQYGNLVAECEIYDPATGQWTQTGSLHYARSSHDALLLPDGRVLVAGGSDIQGNPILQSEIYDPATGTWIVDASTNAGHTDTASMVMLSTGKALLASGNNGSTELYTPEANHAPIVGAISVSPNPVQVNNATTASASFTDADTADTHTATWNWGDIINGNPDITTGTVTESNGSGSVSDNHTYTTAGVYTVTLTVTDNHGATGQSTFQFVSVYNPTSQGLFTAGQHFTSPAGAYTANTSLTGTVKFGLSYKYQGTMPVGDRQFTMNFPAANLLFNATTVSSLVIANNVATLTGTGTINGGSTTYNFLVVGVNGGNIRVQITDPSNNNAVIYDTQPGDPATATPTTSVTGNVIAHN